MVSYVAEELFRLASVGRRVTRLQQSGDHDYALRAGGDHICKIFQLDPAYAKDRNGNALVHLANLFKPNRRVIRLGWRGEDRAQANVIGALPFGSYSLRNAVS